MQKQSVCQIVHERLAILYPMAATVILIKGLIMLKKFIALVALVLVSASTMMYAQESNAAARRAERKAQRDTH